MLIHKGYCVFASIKGFLHIDIFYSWNDNNVIKAGLLGGKVIFKLEATNSINIRGEFGTNIFEYYLEYFQLEDKQKQPTKLSMYPVNIKSAKILLLTSKCEIIFVTFKNGNFLYCSPFSYRSFNFAKAKFVAFNLFAWIYVWVL